MQMEIKNPKYVTLSRTSTTRIVGNLRSGFLMMNTRRKRNRSIGKQVEASIKRTTNARK